MALQYCLGLFRVVSLDCRGSIRLIGKSGPQEHPNHPRGEREHLAVAMITREIIYNLTSKPNHQIQFFDQMHKSRSVAGPGELHADFSQRVALLTLGLENIAETI